MYKNVKENVRIQNRWRSEILVQRIILTVNYVVSTAHLFILYCSILVFLETFLQGPLRLVFCPGYAEKEVLPLHYGPNKSYL